MFSTTAAQLGRDRTSYVFAANSRKPKKNDMAEPRPENRLLALPPEVRNKIYDILFRFKDPVAFLGLQEQTYLRSNDVKVDKHPGDLKHYVALLRTCRQIYSEAGGVLYGSNNFKLAHAHSVLHDRNLNYMLHATARWLKPIESRFALLRTVTVTLNKNTKSDGGLLIRSEQRFHGCFDILPLVRLYWSDTSGNLQVRFSDTAGVLQMLADQDANQLYRPVNTDVLHRVLQQLGRGDIWDLKKSRSFLRSILLRRDGCYGYVCYRSAGPRTSFLRKFNVLNCGKEMRLFHSQKPSSFVHVPKHVQQRILTEALRYEHVKYDTGSSKWLKHSFAILDVCRPLHTGWEISLQCRGKFMLNEQVYSQTSHFRRAGPFGDARWLLRLRKDVNKHLRKKPVYQRRIPFEAPRPSHLHPPIIMLDLSSATATSLSTVTISATRLHQLKGFPSSTPVSFRLSATTDQDFPTEELTTTLGDIVRRIFLLLSDVYFASPPWAHYHRTIDTHINGQGTPLYAVLQPDGDEPQLTIPNRRPRTSAPDVARLVRSRIARLKHDWITARFTESQAGKGKAWDRTLVTMLGHFGAMCAAYQERDTPNSNTKSKSQTDDVDISDFDGEYERVSKVRKDTEGVNFKAAEFRAVNWREVLCYGVNEGKRGLGKSSVSPLPILRAVPHYGCGGCTSKCVRGSVGPDKLLRWRTFKGLPRSSSEWWRH